MSTKWWLHLFAWISLVKHSDSALVDWDSLWFKTANNFAEYKVKRCCTHRYIQIDRHRQIQTQTGWRTGTVIDKQSHRYQGDSGDDHCRLEIEIKTSDHNSIHTLPHNTHAPLDIGTRLHPPSIGCMFVMRWWLCKWGELCEQEVILIKLADMF